MSTDYAAVIETGAYDSQYRADMWELCAGFVWLWDPRKFYDALLDNSREGAKPSLGTAEFFNEHKATAGRTDMDTDIRCIPGDGRLALLSQHEHLPPDWGGLIDCALRLRGRYNHVRILWWAS